MNEVAKCKGPYLYTRVAWNQSVQRVLRSLSISGSSW